VIVVADSSSPIALAKLGYLDPVRKLYSRLHISGEVYAEIVVAGAGMPGASQVAKSDWIEVTAIQNSSG
jgi:predicted nucleic acid-binding protein